MPQIVHRILVNPCSLLMVNCKSCYHRAPAVSTVLAAVLEHCCNCKVLLALPTFSQDWRNVVVQVDDCLRERQTVESAQLGCLPFAEKRKIFVANSKDLVDLKGAAWSYYTARHGPIRVDRVGLRPKAKARPVALSTTRPKTKPRVDEAGVFFFEV